MDLNLDQRALVSRLILAWLLGIGIVPAAEIVIDNGDPGYSVSGVTEQEGITDAYSGDQAFNTTSGNTGQSASYTFEGLASGNYEVFASWRQGGQGNVGAMKVAVSDGGPTVDVVQTNIGPTADLVLNDGAIDVNFQKIGEVTVSDGQLVVTTSLGSGNFFINDAIAINALIGDADNDGMPDDWEDANGLNKLVDDAAGNPDGDGLTNLQEFQRGTDPQDDDSDGDGLQDHVEDATGTWTSAAATGTDPNLGDSDGDGLLDGVEDNTGIWVSVAQTGTNPNLLDSDNDGLGDGIENPDETFVDAATPGTDPNDPDSDGDSFSDGIEALGGSDPTDADSTPSATASPQDIVINEIHYDPEDKTRRSEFIELYNRGVHPVNLTGWQLSNAVDYTFPGVTLLAGEYLVIAEDPATLLADFGATAIGPWVGGLSNQGERITLRDNLGNLADEVDYGVGFPWPTAAHGDSASMELIDPALDNDLSGSWRSASVGGYTGPAIDFLTAGDDSWTYRTGQTFPAADGSGRQWNENGYDDAVDGQWVSGVTPIGYGDGDDETEVTGMAGSYISLFLRNEFEIAPGQIIPSALSLRAYFDDGCVVYINGEEVERFSLQNGTIPFPPPDGFATSHEAAWESQLLAGAGNHLQIGTNTIAIQVINATVGSSDLSIDAELKTPPTGDLIVGQPTPGAANSNFSTTAPPQIRQVEHLPKSPSSSDAVTITAKITDPGGVNSVTLSYQIVDPGSYIRKSDPGFETTWIDVPMVDDGTAGDAFAGDDRFTAVLPESLQVHRRMVRYRITASDGAGSGVRVPYFDDPQPNFAYFCYDGVPDWTAAARPGVTAPLTFSGDLLESIPVYHLVANGTDVSNCQYSSGSRNTRFLGTMVYDGEVYDHIEFNIRGEGSTYRTGKNKWRFRFNRGHDFQARDNFGNEYASGWRDMKVNGGTAPWTYVNRGMAGVDECLTYRLFNLAGVPASRTSYFHFRVIDGATEQSPSDQYEGDLWGLYFNIEVPDGRFLDDRGLPDGNVYKLDSQINKDNQGPNDTSGTSDITGIRSQMSTGRSEQWWQDNTDVPLYGRYKGVAEAITHYDQRDNRQGYYYHDPVRDKWLFMPWDCDTMFQLTEKYYTWDRYRLCVDSGYPNNFREAKNQQREILDLLFNAKAVDTAMAEFVDIVNPAGEAQTLADMDLFAWDYNPRTPGQFKGSYNVLTGSSNPAGRWYTRTLISADHEGQMDYLRKFMQPGGWGYDKLVAEVADNLIPDTPVISYSGSAGFPVNGLQLQTTAFSGAGSFAAMQWRIGEISDPFAPNFDLTQVQPYEIDPIWESGELTIFNANIDVPSASIRAGSTYRARVRYLDSVGRWSHWSAPLEFTATLPDISQYLDSLVISEVMYKPDGDNLEFVEIMNVGATTIDLSDVRFTKGVDFDFAGSTITSLAPGGYALIVQDLAAFELAYGVGLPVAGVFTNQLSNGGEQLKLSFGAGAAIRDFVYDDVLPWPTIADDSEHSLVLIDPQSVPDHSVASNWRGSALPGGNPGVSDALPAFSGSAETDSDNDGLGALLEHAFGGSDADADDARYPLGAVEVLSVGGNPDDYLVIRVQRNLAAEDVRISASLSSDLILWQYREPHSVLHSETSNGDGTSTLMFRSGQPVSAESRMFIRAFVQTNP